MTQGKLMEATEKKQVISALISSRKATFGSRIVYTPEILATGTHALDSFLPHGGFERGGITELVGDGPRHTLAALVMAAASRTGEAAYLGPAGIINPALLTAAHGELENCYFLAEPVAERLQWSVQQLLASGLFQLVIFYASNPASGFPLLSPPTYRRFLGHTRDTRTVLILLLDHHQALLSLGRPCALRLEISGPPQPDGEDRRKNCMHLRIMKSATAPIGKEMVLRYPC